MKIRKLHIKKYKILNNFDLDFTFAGKPQNLLVIAGINGSGKTTLFECINDFFAKKTVASDSIFLDFDKEENNSGEKIFYFKANEQNTENTEEIIAEFVSKLIFEQKLNPETAAPNLAK